MMHARKTNKKIGQVTLYDYNFGSVLQCYALQQYLIRNYCDCELLRKKEGARLLAITKRLLSLGALFLRHPFCIRTILHYFLSCRAGSLSISRDSLFEIKRFIRYNIRTKSASWRELISLGESEEYAAFITGSDQVWNGHRVDEYDMSFLQFAPKYKRVAYAPSFGGVGVTKYNRSQFTRSLASFPYLSVREAVGVDIIKELVGFREVPVLLDPVFILTVKEWRDYVSSNTTYNSTVRRIAQKYLLAIFLDVPTESALNCLRELRQEIDYPIISFAYQYKEYEEFVNYMHIDGTPFDFISFIDNAEMIVTDSFHVTAFALLLHSKFYVYGRAYKHAQNQSNRITSLLSCAGISDRYECKHPAFNDEIDFSSSDKYIEKSKTKSEDYIRDTLSQLGLERRDGIKEKAEQKINLSSDSSKCCGCGMCADNCRSSAITMKLDDGGVLYPQIDIQKCSNCKACIKACPLKSGSQLMRTYEQKVYIGIGTDDDLISKSASGGVFATIAEHVLSQGGIVYGAALSKSEGIDCHHIAVSKKKDLALIQGSKYMQSRTEGVFLKVKQNLVTGKLVLFSGTSCQVAALKAFLKKPFDNLVTVDLVCHGVPQDRLFTEYLTFVEEKYNCGIESLSFRRKDIGKSRVPYVMTFDCIGVHGKRYAKTVPLRNSAFYRLYMANEGYRESCYSCQFATIDKPADITLGDYYPDDGEMKLIARKRGKADSFSTYYSMLLINSAKGQRLVEECDSKIDRVRISLETAKQRHDNLRHASLPQGNKLWEIYKTGGFNKLDKYLGFRNKIMCIPSAVKGLLKKN